MTLVVGAELLPAPGPGAASQASGVPDPEGPDICEPGLQMVKSVVAPPGPGPGRQEATNIVPEPSLKGDLSLGHAKDSEIWRESSSVITYGYL